jgi:hypothetical protein
MSTENDAKTKNSPPAGQNPTPASTPTLPPGGLTTSGPLFGGEFTGTITQPSPTQYQGVASYLFKNGDSIGASALVGTQPWKLEQYGVNGDFGFGNGGRAKFGFDAMPPKDTYKWMTDIKFGDGSSLNTDLTKTPKGEIFNVGGTWKINQEQQLSGTGQINTIDKTKDLQLKWSHTDKHFFNFGFNDSPAGAVFKGDGKATLKPGETIAGDFELNGVTKTNGFNLKWNDNDKHGLNFGLSDGPGGTIVKGGGKTTIKPGETIAGDFELNGVTKTNGFNFKWNDNDKHSFNFGLNNGPTGSILKLDGKTSFGKGETATASFERNTIEHFKAYSLGYASQSGNKLDFSLKDTRGGSIYDLNGKLMLGEKDYLTGKLKIDGVEKTQEFGLGANIKGNQYNFDLSKTPAGTTFGLGGKFNYDEGRGNFGIDAKFGPKLSEVGGSINYKYKDLEYSGNIKFNNADNRAFGLAEIGAKLSKGDDRFKYGIEAGFNPRTGDVKVMAGISISFGGGSKRMSAPETNAIPDRQTDPVADFKQKQSQAFDKQAIDRLNPNDRALYDQAKAGVEKLNAQGASFNVEKTAMYLAAQANEKGFTKIGDVQLGKPMADGRQNLFIFDRESGNPMAKSAMADPAVAANTPVRDSAEIMHRTPDAVDVHGAAAKTDPQTVANPEVTGVKRSGY